MSSSSLGASSLPEFYRGNSTCNCTHMQSPQYRQVHNSKSSIYCWWWCNLQFVCCLSVGALELTRVPSATSLKTASRCPGDDGFKMTIGQSSGKGSEKGPPPPAAPLPAAPAAADPTVPPAAAASPAAATADAASEPHIDAPSSLLLNSGAAAYIGRTDCCSLDCSNRDSTRHIATEMETQGMQTHI